MAVEARASAAVQFSVSSEVALIYGIGSAGVLPFERLLADKQEGDAILFQLAKVEAGDFFGHLTASFIDLFDQHNEACFRARILRIETPEPREVVKAIAEMTAHGHGGGCDCGCGCG